MNHNRSVATIDAPEFINLEPNAINPGISQCEIKVFYLGKNRNGSFIDKNTAIQMANSLPGTPIVGAWRKDIEDFGDHGHVMHIENGEVEFSCKTVPFGFVAPDAQVWFQTFTDTNEFGEEIQRDYVMTTGYLWTDQYPEVTACLNDGKGQSMELDEKTLKGHWATEDNSGMEFFIINDAIFSKLCILGDDVEPCFEGAAVTGPSVSKNFSHNPEFSQTLFSMMNELKFALQNKGGSDMPKDKELEAQETEEQVETEVEVAEEHLEDADNEEETEEAAEEVEESEDSEESEEGDADEAEGSEFAKDDDDEDEEESEESDEEDDDEKKKKKAASEHSLEEQTVSLQNQISSMQDELDALREFKKAQDNLQKDALINKYFMLTAEDKAEVIAHKEEFSLEEIDAQLALIYVKNNVDFSLADGHVEPEMSEDVVTTFSLNDENAGYVPPTVEALRQTKRN